MTNFITNLAIVFATLSGLLIISRIYGAIKYTEEEELYDAIQGYKKEYPIVLPIIIFMVCLIWLFSV